MDALFLGMAAGFALLLFRGKKAEDTSHPLNALMTQPGAGSGASSIPAVSSGGGCCGSSGGSAAIRIGVLQASPTVPLGSPAAPSAPSQPPSYGNTQWYTHG